MDDPNLRTVEAMFEEFARGEDEVAFSVFDEEIVWDARAADIPEVGGIFHGHDGVRDWWRRWLASWDRIEISSGPDHVVHGNQVLSSWHQHNVGAGSGARVGQEAALIYTFLGGKVIHVAVFVDHESAFRAFGAPHGP